MESFAQFRHFHSNTPNLPERSLARELYHTRENNLHAFGFIDLNLRNRRGQTVSARKRNDGDVYLDKGQVNSPTEGGRMFSGENPKDNAEVGGDRYDDEEEEEYQGSEHEASVKKSARRSWD